MFSGSACFPTLIIYVESPSSGSSSRLRSPAALHPMWCRWRIYGCNALRSSEFAQRWISQEYVEQLTERMS